MPNVSNPCPNSHVKKLKAKDGIKLKQKHNVEVKIEHDAKRTNRWLNNQP
jgi:hypothetical protein